MWREIIRQLPRYEELDAGQQVGAREAFGSLMAAVQQGQINVAGVSRIADFGACLGGSTYGLVAKFGSGVTIDALEQAEPFVYWIRKSNIVPDENVKLGDGIAYLKDYPLTYDLITAFRLGPDSQGRIFRELVAASAIALRPEGVLIVTSDDVSFRAALTICDRARVPRYLIPESDGWRTVPATLIIHKSSCETIIGQS